MSGRAKEKKKLERVQPNSFVLNFIVASYWNKNESGCHGSIVVTSQSVKIPFYAPAPAQEELSSHLEATV